MQKRKKYTCTHTKKKSTLSEVTWKNTALLYFCLQTKGTLQRHWPCFKTFCKCVWTFLFIFVTDWSLQQGSHLFRRSLFTWLLGWSFITDLQSQKCYTIPCNLHSQVKSITRCFAVFTVKSNCRSYVAVSSCCLTSVYSLSTISLQMLWME